MAEQVFPIVDPICGMALGPEQVAATCTYLGQDYAFCCEECRDLFVRAPEKHVVRLAHEPDQSAGHRCPLQRGEMPGGLAPFSKAG